MTGAVGFGMPYWQNPKGRTGPQWMYKRIEVQT